MEQINDGDSSHEEMIWWDAAISPAFSGSDMDLKSLQREGQLPPQQHLTWHDGFQIRGKIVSVASILLAAVSVISGKHFCSDPATGL
jgi:hypothetical protein